jgi:hypothetical protein
MVETSSLLRVSRLRVWAIVAGIIIYIVGHLLLLLQECHLLRVKPLLRDCSCCRHHRSYSLLLLLCLYHHIHLHKHGICGLRICHFQLVDHHHHLLSVLLSNHLGISQRESSGLGWSCTLIYHCWSWGLLLVLWLKILLSLGLLLCALREHIDVWNLIWPNHILKLLCGGNLIYHHTLVCYLHIWGRLPKLSRSQRCLCVWMNMLLRYILWLTWHTWHHSLHGIHHDCVTKWLQLWDRLSS